MILPLNKVSQDVCSCQCLIDALIAEVDTSLHFFGFATLSRELKRVLLSVSFTSLPKDGAQIPQRGRDYKQLKRLF